MDSKFDQFLLKQSERNIDLVISLDRILLSYPNIHRKIRYGIPFYDHKSWFCYINPIKAKKEGVELCFLKGTILRTYFPVLERRNRSMVAGIEIDIWNESIAEKITPVIEEAIQLNAKPI